VLVELVGVPVDADEGLRLGFGPSLLGALPPIFAEAHSLEPIGNILFFVSHEAFVSFEVGVIAVALLVVLTVVGLHPMGRHRRRELALTDVLVHHIHMAKLLPIGWLQLHILRLSLHWAIHQQLLVEPRLVLQDQRVHVLRLVLDLIPDRPPIVHLVMV